MIQKHKCKNCENIVVRKEAILCRICANKEISKNRNKRIEPVGKDRWNYKEETIQHGYTTLYDPTHIKADCHGRVFRSILVLEKKIGRKLLKEELAHHINEIKSDDSPENLELMDTKQHKSYHLSKNKPSKWYLLNRDKNGRFVCTNGSVKCQ